VLVIVDWGAGGPQVVGQGAIAAPMFALKGPSMIKGSYPPAFALKHQQKDIRLALAMAEDNALPTPVAASVNELYKRAKAAGLGDQDFSAILEAFELDPKQSNHWQQFCPWICLFASSQLCTQMRLGGDMDIYINLILKTLISGMHQTAHIFPNTGGGKDYKKSHSQVQQVHNPELY
jgi:hypothetical protein